ncbi:hypothetical protein HYH03_006845 [Edaphochlamys debaryana]|uniref:Uncharacterized protein n=1 Tax=Edaphochlamys debaryana TaxID=47281 RepID=A0A835Y2T1_9CHLO|nr:hypothetical protein HYH03_006845 [Edaphochlamys debaryana]|eukprot:KAG2494910.1 hypothetical protein HYH03_006845 [Edaphochlamys debaryana]
MYLPLIVSASQPPPAAAPKPSSPEQGGPEFQALTLEGDEDEDADRVAAGKEADNGGEGEEGQEGDHSEAGAEGKGNESTGEEEGEQGQAARSQRSVMERLRRSLAARAPKKPPSPDVLVYPDSRLRSMTEASKKLLEEARRELEAVFNRTEAARAAGNATCSLRVGLFVEVMYDAQLAAIMPTNALRNAAGLMAQTPLAAMLDVDLGISASLSRMAADPEWMAKVAVLVARDEDGPGIAIIPAFETNHKHSPAEQQEVLQKALAGKKSMAADLYKGGALAVFHASHCPMCHGPINHGFWVKAKDAYPIDFERGFEPWGILPRFEDPGYDERFRGWCYDKIQHVDTLARLRDFRFLVLPDVWLVHRWHEPVAIASLYRGSRGEGEEGEHGKGKGKAGGRGGKLGGGKALAPPPPAGNSSGGGVTPAELHVGVEQAKHALLQEVEGLKGEIATAYHHYRARADWLIRTQRSEDLTATLREVAKKAGKPWEQKQRNPQLKRCRKQLPWWKDGYDKGA